MNYSIMRARKRPFRIQQSRIAVLIAPDMSKANSSSTNDGMDPRPSQSRKIRLRRGETSRHENVLVQMLGYAAALMANQEYILQINKN